MNLKKNFIRINIIVSFILLVTFLIIFFTILNKVSDLDVDYFYFQILYVITGISLVQLVVFLIYFFAKFKSINYKTVLSLLFLIAVLLTEIKFLFRIIGGFLGDM